MLIGLTDVSKRYTTRSGGSVIALEGVTFGVGADEFVTIVGASGCGKSTVLKLIGGLVAPTSGRVLLRDHPVTGPSRDTGMVFQNPVLLPWRSVRDNLLFVCPWYLPPESEGR